MRVSFNAHGVSLWLSANDTATWADRPGARWPCSQLSGKRLFAQFDKGGLVDVTINGRSGVDCDVTEFNAITSDFLAAKLPQEHPAWFVAVGQFQDGYRDALSSELGRSRVTTWTNADSDAATAEGWDVFNVDATPGSADRTRLERSDEAEIFPGDYEAWIHVVTRAAAGSDLHKRALAVVRERNQDEWNAITETAREQRLEVPQ